MNDGDAMTIKDTAEKAPESGGSPGFTLFATGFLMSFFSYVILRIASMKLPVNFFVPFMVCFALFGGAIGAFVSGGLDAARARRFHTAAMTGSLLYLAAVFINMKAPTQFLLLRAEFPVEFPPFAGLRAVAEIVALFLPGFLFFPLGLHFSEAFERTTNAARAYALHLAGFLLGGGAAYLLAVRFGLYFCLMSATIALSMLYAGSRSMKVATVAVCLFLTAFMASIPDSFFIWQLRDYTKLSTEWSPYSKIDFITFNDGKCMASLYNNFLMNGVCSDPMLDHLQRRKVFEIVGPGRDEVLILGAGTGMSMLSLLRANPHITRGVGVEIDPVVAREAVGRYGKYGGAVYRRPEMRMVVSDARRFLDTDTHKYDLIFIDGIDNLLDFYLGSLVSAENYAYTAEGYRRIFDERLKKDGVLIMNHGGSVVPNIFPFLIGIPPGVTFRTYWYAVMDPPFSGAPLFFMIASRDRRAVERYVRRLDEDSAMVPVRPPAHYPKMVYTDNHPTLYLAHIFLMAPLSALILIGFLLATRHFLRAANRDADPGAAAMFHYFILTGFVYAVVESFLIIKTARYFPSPALGYVIVLSLFIAGCAAANLWHGGRGRAGGVWVPAIGMGAACAAVVLFNSREAGAAGSFAAGFFAGYFWPSGLAYVNSRCRHYAYAMDGLGAILGTLVFQVVFLLFGLWQSALVAFLAALGVSLLYAKAAKAAQSIP